MYMYNVHDFTYAHTHSALCMFLIESLHEYVYFLPDALWSCCTRVLQIPIMKLSRAIISYNTYISSLLYMRMHVCAEYQPVFQTADGFWSHLGPSSFCTQWNVNSLPTPGSSSSEESELHGTAITWQGATLQSWAARNWLSHEILPFPQSPVRWCPPCRLVPIWLSFCPFV